MKRILLTLSVFLIMGCSTENKNIITKMPDLALLNDGIYSGNFDLKGTPVKVTLEVNVQNNRISNIKIIKHICSPIGKKAEKIIDDVINKQSLEVDAVSGATGSSKSILKAIENALNP